MTKNILTEALYVLLQNVIQWRVVRHHCVITFRFLAGFPDAKPRERMIPLVVDMRAATRLTVECNPFI